MSFCLYEFCRNPEKQRKVQDEIDKVFGNVKSLDDITYEMMKDLKYLQSCLDEALRLYPALPTLFRKCVKDFKIPGTDLTIEKGTSVHIPVMAIHRDPRNFENPLNFEPERFTTSNGKGLYIFGDGPRMFLLFVFNSVNVMKFFQVIALACEWGKLSQKLDSHQFYGNLMSRSMMKNLSMKHRKFKGLNFY